MAKSTKWWVALTNEDHTKGRGFPVDARSYAAALAKAERAAADGPFVVDYVEPFRVM